MAHRHGRSAPTLARTFAHNLARVSSEDDVKLAHLFVSWDGSGASAARRQHHIPPGASSRVGKSPSSRLRQIVMVTFRVSRYQLSSPKEKEKDEYQIAHEERAAGDHTSRSTAGGDLDGCRQ